MALVLKDRVLETCSAPGTGTVSLLGAVTGYQSFSSVGNGNTCYYAIADQSGANWEVGIGTYATAGSTLTRTTVLSSSNAGSLTNFSSGTQNVFLTYPSERSVNLNSAALTSGRVPYATTDGLLTDSSGLTYDGTNLNIGTSTSVTNRLLNVQGSSVAKPVLVQTTTTNSLIEFNDSGTATKPAMGSVGDALTFWPAGIEKMRIDASGNVGIGITPTNSSNYTTLEVSNATNGGIFNLCNGATNKGQSFYDSSGLGFNTLGTAKNIRWKAGAISGSTDAHMTLDTSGNLGIGTSSPISKLDIRSTGELARFANTTSGVVYVLVGGGSSTTEGLRLTYDNTDGSSTINNYYNASLKFSTNNTERMRITASGNLGIGTSSPSTILQVSTGTPVVTITGTGTTASSQDFTTNGAAQRTTIGVEQSTGGGLFVGSSAYAAVFGSAGASSCQLASNNNVRMTITSAGDVGIGVTPSTWSQGAGFELNVKGSGLWVYTGATNGQTQLMNNAYYNGGWTYAGNGGACLYNQTAGVHGWYTTSAGTGNTAISFTQSMTLNSSGNLGIGTTNPGSVLDVASSAAGEYGTIIRNTSTSTVAAPILRFYAGSGSETGAILRFASTHGARPNELFITNVGTTSPMVFATQDTERMRIDSSGNVGIGTTSISSKLYVAGGTDDQLLRVGNTNAIGSQYISIYANGSLTYYNSVNTQNSVFGSHVWNSQNNAGAVERARIDSSGNLLVGTTTAVSKLTVSGGKITINSTDSSYGQIQIGNGNSNGEASMAFVSGATALGGSPTSVNGNNYVWAVGAGVFGVNGDNWAIGNRGTGSYVAKIAYNSTSWTFASDERLKDLDGEIENAVEKVAGLRAVYYTWKSDDSKTRKVGLIAQDVLKVLPEAVDKPAKDTKENGDPNYLGLGMSDVVPLLVAAIKEQQAIIESLNARLTTLENK